MPLYNAASRARHVGSLINRPQGGGEKKAGFPKIIGRDSWTSIFLKPNSTTLNRINVEMPFRPVRSNRPTWVRPGTAYGR